MISSADFKFYWQKERRSGISKTLSLYFCGMNKAFIGLGSNIGDREFHIESALKRMREAGTVSIVSSFFYNPAEGLASGHDFEFVNAVCLLETEMPADALIRFLLNIEAETGRTRLEKDKISRKIDLDLLLFNEDRINNELLIVPHPRMTTRLFVMQPLTEIAPQLIIPGQDKTVQEIKNDLLDAEMKKRNGLTV